MEKMRKALWVVRGKRVAVLGLAFKPGTDDMREAPSLQVIRGLLREGAVVRCHDPRAAESARQALGAVEGVTLCATPYEAAEGAHALVLLTEWEDYRLLDLARLREVMEVPVLIDGRNFFEPAQVRQMGFDYYGVGR